MPLPPHPLTLPSTIRHRPTPRAPLPILSPTLRTAHLPIIRPRIEFRLLGLRLPFLHLQQPGTQSALAARRATGGRKRDDDHRLDEMEVGFREFETVGAGFLTA